MFTLDHMAEIRAINIAKGKQDEAPVCLTISLMFEGVDLEPIAAALGCHTKELETWFHENGDPIFTGIEHIESWAYYENEHRLQMLKFKCEIAKVSKIKFKPTAGKRFTVWCALQIQEPANHVIENIAERLHEKRKVKLIQAEQLPLEGGNVTKLNTAKS